MRLQALLAGGLGLGAFILASPGFAANADIVPDVKPIFSPVSVSRDCTSQGTKCTPLTSFAAYEITITNNTTNAINQVVVVGTATVNGDDAKPVTLKESIGASCPKALTKGAKTEITCDVGQVKGSTSFVVIFESPTVGSSIDFSIAGTFSNAASPSTPSSGLVDGTFSHEAVNIPLTTILTDVQQKSFKTVVPSTGGTFLTGTGVPTDIDTFVTRLGVPSQTSQSGSSYSIATADEWNPADESNPFGETCPTSAPCGGSVNLSLKKSGGEKAKFYPPNPVNVLREFLVIELWRSDFKGNIKNANVYYKDPVDINPTYVPVYECAPYPIAGSVARCIYDRKVFSSKDDEVKLGKVPEGAARIRILAGENGWVAW